MRQELAILMREYYGDGTYARFFDRAGRLELKERFIVFDLKGLSRNPDLQRVFLKVAMIWADEVMNTPSELDTRKLLVFDEDADGEKKCHYLIMKGAYPVAEIDNMPAGYEIKQSEALQVPGLDAERHILIVSKA